MIKNILTTITSLAVVLLGTTALWFGTDGFYAFTTETARRLEIINNPRIITTVELENQDGDTISLSKINKSIVIADFIYTRCPSFCNMMGNEFTELQNSIKRKGLAGHIALLSITFDSEHDTPKAINAYLEKHGADRKLWQGVRIIGKENESTILEEFGVTVIPDQFGGYVHNAAFYVIHENTIRKIFDYTERELLLTDVQTILSNM